METPPSLHDFVAENRSAIIAACEVKVAKRTAAPNAVVLINHGVPMFLDQLVDELRVGLSSSSQIDRTAAQHGNDLLRQGYTVSQVVHGYGDVCQSITEMALEQNAAITTDDFRMLNRCLDNAIAGAVTGFGDHRDQHAEGESEAESDRVESLAVELRAAIRTSKAALEVIASGDVGVSGTTGVLLMSRIVAAVDLVDRLLDEVKARRPKSDAPTRPRDPKTPDRFDQ